MSDTETLAPAELTPTPEQAAALESMQQWLKDGYAVAAQAAGPLETVPSEELQLNLPSTTKLKGKFNGPRFFCLRGYAGTGKSYSITLLAKSGLLKPEEICFTAPTNKAVKVLRNYLDGAGLENSPSKTIYSLLGLSLQANGEVKELSKPEEPVNLSAYKVIVCDEASMVNRFLMEAVNDAFDDWSVPFLFMGDPAQLPPVGEITSPVWKIEPFSELTTVMRYGNSMLDLATAIRKQVDNPFPSIKIETCAPVFRETRTEWLDQIMLNLELFKSGEAKVIAWRNVTVDKYNQLIRAAIFGRQEAKLNDWLEGDKIVATAHLKDLEDNTFMRTDEEATVLACTVGSHPRFKEFEIFNLLCLGENERKCTIRTLTDDGRFHLNNRLNELAAEAKTGKRYKWKEFWTLKEAFNEIRHSYAITSHRSQGSSYLKTFIDLEDIMQNRNRPEAFRSLYVACTRQREELHIS